MTCADCSNNAQGDLLLAINGADERLQLALGLADVGGVGEGGVSLLASQEWTVPGQAVRFLVPGVLALLNGVGRSPADVRRIACVTGPGSFTGLRMSLAAAQGMAAGSGALLAGINHLELLAHDAATLPAPTAEEQAAVLALAWSRRAQVYAQAFRAKGDSEAGSKTGDKADNQMDTTLALCPPLALRLEEVPELVATLRQRQTRPLSLLGGGLRRNLPFFEALAATTPALHLLPRRWDAPKPETLLLLAARAQYLPAAEIKPVYLRASDAEDNLAAIAAGRGLSAEEAQAILDRGSRTL